MRLKAGEKLPQGVIETVYWDKPVILNVVGETATCVYAFDKEIIGYKYGIYGWFNRDIKMISLKYYYESF